MSGADRDRSAEHGWNGSTAVRTPGARACRVPVRELTPKERRKAARLLASRAADADDLRELLALAGLTAEDGFLPLDPP